MIDLDDLEQFDPDLAEAVQENTRRYVQLFADVVQDLLPGYKEKDVSYLSTLPLFGFSVLIYTLYIAKAHRMMITLYFGRWLSRTLSMFTLSIGC